MITTRTTRLGNILSVNIARNRNKPPKISPNFNALSYQWLTTSAVMWIINE